MSLPGVTTVLKDRFFTLTRTDVPEGSRVIGVARRDAVTEPYTYTGLEADLVEVAVLPGTPEAGNEAKIHKVDDVYYEYVTTEWVTLGTDVGQTPNYRPFAPRSEQTVVQEFGEGSELHRCFLEMVQGGAAQVYLLPVPSTIDDTGLEGVLDEIFDGVELIRPDIVILWGRGGHVDDPTRIGFYVDLTPTFATAVATKCKTITDRSNPCFAVIGVEPATGEEVLDATETDTHITALPTRGEASINGQYLSVVGIELKPIAYWDAFGWANGAASYGAFVSTLPSEVGGTGKRIPDVAELRYGFTRPQQVSVIEKGIVPIAFDSLGRSRVVDALTYAVPPSDYTRLSTLRIVFDAVQMVRNATEPFVGQPSTLHHRNSMETAISSALRNMQVVGALLGSDFVVTYLARENKAQIDLVLIPAFEMRNIEVSVAVQL